MIKAIILHFNLSKISRKKRIDNVTIIDKIENKKMRIVGQNLPKQTSHTAPLVRKGLVFYSLRLRYLYLPIYLLRGGYKDVHGPDRTSCVHPGSTFHHNMSHARVVLGYPANLIFGSSLFR